MYYRVRIENENITQKLAEDIFKEVTTTHKIRDFHFIDECSITYNTLTGLTNISSILKRHGIPNEDVSIFALGGQK